jgi:hypothetical protein
VAQFVESQVEAFLSMRSLTIESWAGLQAALRGWGADEKPVFNDSQVPLEQFLHLVVTLSHLGSQRVGTYQNDTVFGLRVDPWSYVVPASSEALRWQDALPLPVGVVQDVEIRLSSTGDVCEVCLEIEGSSLLLMAGEVEELGNSALRYTRLDESVLVLSPSAAAGLEWVPPRRW